MYQPPHFAAKDPALVLQLMRENPFATLVGTDDSGAPFITHLPLTVLASGDGHVIEGHVAKPNPHWRYLQARPQATAIFMGPHAYLSPSVYPDLARVPTWNYLTVHAHGTVALVEGVEEKDALLKRLIATQEPAYAQQWIDLGTEFQHKMLQGIVGFRLTVTKLDAKFKLNQHRPEAHAKMLAQLSAGNAREQALGQWMGRLGLPKG
jgi:transcriptional regulator